MYMIPDDDYDTSIKHAMLHADLSQIYDMSKEKRNLILPYEDRQKIIRDKKRAERAQLNSADGDTGEYHDQFYRDHKLLLVLFRALAVMPITRSSPGRVTFSWKSLATIYAIFFYIAMSVDR